MTSLAINHSFELAPHATRVTAMVLTLGLYLVLALFALRPTTPFEHHAPPPEALLASILQPPPPALPLPVTAAVPHVAAPVVHVALPRPTPVTMPVLAAITPVTPVSTPAVTSTHAVTTPAAGGDHDATIAYATASAPPYPLAALRNGVQGTVMLKVLVDVHGIPVQVVITHTSGSRLLDDAARAHVLAAWRFHPAIRDGHPVAAWALVPVKFSLDRF